MNKTPVHIVCACNASYIMPLCVMLASLVRNFSRDRDLCLHIIINDITEPLRENVRKSIEMNRPGLERIILSWYAISDEVLERFPTPNGHYLTKDTYARLFIPELLPTTCEQVIYLDADMVILGDVAVLHDTAWGVETSVHAVQDLFVPWVSMPLGVFDFQRRGIPPETRYFSAGVLVINLKRWREKNVAGEVIDYLTTNGLQIHFEDQGALNAILARDWTPLPLRWNHVPQILFERVTCAAGYTREQWREERDHPQIVHYNGGRKPWKPGWRSPRGSYFFHYLKQTVYRGSVPHRLQVEDVTGFLLYYRIWSLARRLVPGMFEADPPVTTLPMCLAGVR